MSQVSMTVFSKLSKFVSVVKNYKKLSKIAKIVQNCQKLSKLSKLSKIVKLVKNCQRNQKWLTQSVSDKVTYWAVRWQLIKTFSFHRSWTQFMKSIMEQLKSHWMITCTMNRRVRSALFEWLSKMASVQRPPWRVTLDHCIVYQLKCSLTKILFGNFTTLFLPETPTSANL